MSSDLDWRTDDDTSEGEWRPAGRQTIPSGSPTAPPRRRWLLWLILASVLVTALAAPFGYGLWEIRRQQNDQRTAVTQLAQLEDANLSAHPPDLEVLATLQDDAFVHWRTLTPTLGAPQTIASPVVSGTADGQQIALLWGNTTRNSYRADTSATLYSAVTLAGDYAVLTATRTYSGFRLIHPQYYFLLNGHWQRTGPPATIWQYMVSNPAASKHIEAMYPLHDAALIETLLPDLEAVADYTCALVDCPPNGHVHITFSANLADLVNPPSTQRQRRSLLVPAPTVLGLPDPSTPAARDALFRFYAIRIARTISQQSPASDAQAAWEAWLLAQLNLEDPLDPTTLRDYARTALQSGTLLRTQRGSAEILAPAALWTALDFLQTTGKVNPFASGFKLTNTWANSVQSALYSRAWTWGAYLETLADLPHTTATDGLLAVVCSNQVGLWNPATDTLRPVGVLTRQAGVWSPDGTYLLVVSSFADVKFTLINALSGERQEGTGTPVAWSPRGNHLLLDTAQGRRIWDPVSKSYSALPVGNQFDWTAWSPTGEFIAYSTTRDNIPQLYVHSVANPEAQIALGAASLGGWSPDGRYLAFNRFASVGYDPAEITHADLALYDLRSGALTTLLTDTQGLVSNIVWAPAASDAGAYIAFSTFTLRRSDGPVTGTVSVVTLAGTLTHRWLMQGSPFELAWSRDARTIGWAFMPSGQNRGEVILADLYSTDLQHFPLDLSYDSLWPTAWARSTGERWLAVDNQGVEIWERDQPATPRRLPILCQAPAWQPGSQD